jgi:uncharacterized protein (TIGR00255 family)
MTGYGRGQVPCGGTRVSVEIQTVNKRQSEILINLPSELNSLEADLRATIDRQLHRGRISVNVSALGSETGLQPVINESLARSYYEEFIQLQKKLSIAGSITIEMILRAPGVISSSERSSFNPATRAAVESALDIALVQLLQMRAKEGAHLHKDLTERLRFIRKVIANIRELQPGVALRYRTLLLDRIAKVGIDLKLDDDRLAKEVAFFAERSDFSEELTRLESHLDQFAGTLAKDEAIGRTLEFITQEIARELNTLTSKANDAEISQMIVQCKAELEKIREQIQNVE